MSPEMIDFHCHHIPARFEVTAGKFGPPGQRGRWEVLARNLADESLLLKDIDSGSVSARVVNIPAQLIADAEGKVPHDTIVAINDTVAALAARHPGKIVGLATVDASTAKTRRARPSGRSASLACVGFSPIAPAAS